MTDNKPVLRRKQNYQFQINVGNIYDIQ